MKKFLMLIVMLAMSLPTSMQAGSNQVDLSGKGTSHLDPSGKNALATGRKVNNLHRAEQGRQALDATMKQHQKNQADMKRSMDHMNKIKMPQATMPDLSR